MIIIGTFMAIGSGLGLPGHMLMFGDIIDLFIAFDIVGSLRSINNYTCTDSGNFSFNFFSMGNETNATEYFCDMQNREDTNVFRYMSTCDLGDLLQSDVGLYSYYYVGLASGLIVTGFFAIALWNWAAYRQTRRMRSAFFRSILQQDIGWFDTSPSAELNTRLSEYVKYMYM